MMLLYPRVKATLMHYRCIKDVGSKVHREGMFGITKWLCVPATLLKGIDAQYDTTVVLPAVTKDGRRGENVTLKALQKFLPNIVAIQVKSRFSSANLSSSLIFHGKSEFTKKKSKTHYTEKVLCGWID